MKDKYKLPGTVLLIFGFVDLLRGFLHTFAIVFASSTFAHLDLSTKRNDQLTLLGAFGISNFLTGMLYILISRKAKELSPYVLAIIPVSYILGFIGLRMSGITSDADFLGKYFMIIYLGISMFTSAYYFLKNRKK